MYVSKKIRRKCFNSEIALKQFGHHLQNARLSKLLDIDTLADISGYRAKEIYDLECGNVQKVNIQMLMDLCAVLDCDWTSLFYFDTEEKKTWRIY